jgi:hypothetical protein
MENTGWCFDLRSSFFRDEVEVYWRQQNSGMCQMVSNLQMRDVQRGLIVEPLIMPRQMLQSILDGVWEGGMRPSQNASRNDEIERHLKDMRAIAFGKLKLPTPL